MIGVKLIRDVYKTASSRRKYKCKQNAKFICLDYAQIWFILQKKTK